MQVFRLTVVLLAFCSVGISALKNITITANNHFNTISNRFWPPSKGKYIYLFDVIVESIAENSLNAFTNIELVFFKTNGIQDIPENFFKYNTKLQFITIIENFLTTLHPNTFATLDKLMMLELPHNRFENIDGNLFRHNGQLKFLNFCCNQITSIHPRAFEGLGSLRTLHLANNQIDSLPDDVFANTVNLQNLYLTNNNIKILSSPALFANNLILSNLYFGENLLQHFDFNILRTNSKIKKLLLLRNELLQIDNYEETQQLLPQLKNIVVSNNFFNCSYYAKISTGFVASNVDTRDDGKDDSTSNRRRKLRAREDCIPDEDYEQELAQRVNVGYNKVSVALKSIAESRQELYEMKVPFMDHYAMQFSLEDFVENVANCGVDGHNVIIPNLCD